MDFPWSVSEIIPLLTAEQKAFFLQNMPQTSIFNFTNGTQIDIDGHDHWYVSFQKGKKNSVYNCIVASIIKEAGCQLGVIDIPMVIDRMVDLFKTNFPNESSPADSPNHCISVSYSGHYLVGPVKFASALKEIKEFTLTHTTHPQSSCVLTYFLEEPESD